MSATAIALCLPPATKAVWAASDGAFQWDPEGAWQRNLPFQIAALEGPGAAAILYAEFLMGTGDAP